MQRRTVIRNLVIISAGAGLLPSCFQPEEGSVVVKNISINSSELKLLKALTDTIIPETNNFTGAKSLRSYEFLLRMIDECTSPEGQKKFTEGLKAFDQLSHDKFGQLFTGYTAEQKQSLLSEIENKEHVSEEAVNFYKTVKHYTIQSFTSSKQYMVDIKKYTMVPGSNFKGCVKIS